MNGIAINNITAFRALGFNPKNTFKARSLAPLGCDTVSFTSNRKKYETIDLSKEPEHFYVRDGLSPENISIVNATYSDLHMGEFVDISKLDQKDVYELFKTGNMETLYGHTYTKEGEDYKFFLDCKDLTLDSDINLFANLDKEPFFAPAKFAIMVDNSLRQNGEAYIIDEIPEIFKDLDPDKVTEALDKFSNLQTPHDGKMYEFNIGNKKIKAEYIDSGLIGDVYKLSDEKGEKVAIKIYHSKTNQISNNGLFVEIPLSIQLKKDGVGNVPKFYMANPVAYGFDDKNRTWYNKGWMVSDFIEDETLVPPHKKSADEWLDEHNMKYWDEEKNGRTKGGYILDIGGMAEKDYKKYRHWNKSGLYDGHEGLMPLLSRSLFSGMSIDDIIQTFE